MVLAAAEQAGRACRLGVPFVSEYTVTDPVLVNYRKNMSRVTCHIRDTALLTFLHCSTNFVASLARRPGDFPIALLFAVGGSL